jgi:DNA-binding GntR family transcriptional regulator
MLGLEITDGIRKEIKAGKRQASDLVSIKYLTQEHDVARQTAAKALGVLAREGLLKRFPGIGYRYMAYVWSSRVAP